jgi:ribosomal protein L29
LGKKWFEKLFKRALPFPRFSKRKRTSHKVLLIRTLPAFFILLILLIGGGFWGQSWMESKIEEKTQELQRQEAEYAKLRRQSAAAQRLIKQHHKLSTIVHEIRSISLEDESLLQASIRELLHTSSATPLLYEVRENSAPLEVYSEEEMQAIIQDSEKNAGKRIVRREAPDKKRDPLAEGNTLFRTQDIALAFVGSYSEVLETIALFEHTGNTSWIDKIIIKPGSKYFSDELQLGIRLTAFLWDPQNADKNQEIREVRR